MDLLLAFFCKNQGHSLFCCVIICNYLTKITCNYAGMVAGFDGNWCPESLEYASKILQRRPPFLFFNVVFTGKTISSVRLRRKYVPGIIKIPPPHNQACPVTACRNMLIYGCQAAFLRGCFPATPWRSPGQHNRDYFQPYVIKFDIKQV